MAAIASGQGTAVNYLAGNIYAPRYYGHSKVSWPVVVGVIPAESEHYQHRPVDDQIAEAAHDNSTALVGQVVSGMGGVGKTQLAIHYVDMLLRDGAVDLVVWIPADRRESIVQTYAEAAHTVLTGRVDENSEWAAKQFLTWLQNTDKPWLVVLDNLDDPDQAKGLWPPTPRGTVLERPRNRVLGRAVVTTRRSDLRPPTAGWIVVPVDTYTAEEALEYVRSAFGSMTAPPVKEELNELIEELGYLPLALSHVAAYLTEPTNHLDCADYLRRFREGKNALSRLMPQQGLPEDYPWTVATTWAISIEHANTLEPQGLAQPLMRLISVLDPAGIPMSLLTTEAIQDFLAVNLPEQEKAEPSADEIEDALRALERLHLISCSGQGSDTSIVVHRLVQRATRDHPDTCPDDDIFHTTIKAIREIWPDIRIKQSSAGVWRGNMIRLAHHSSSLPAKETFKSIVELFARMVDQELFWELYRILLSGMLGKNEVARMIEHHLGARLLRLTLETPEEFVIRAKAAHAQGEKGDPEGASRLFRELLDDCQEVLSLNHPDAITLQDATMYWNTRAGV
ncbi:ATP-binding protein [Nocardiopsis sp. EMB25]|uniref:DUF7779 domain-containing protein n=1 Tax=Nocardiopsis sp. EMB25 TaxID=2835867 RepID=UPI0022845DA7|nr:NB-ARC domain-containing protein [Nocardiopsis sp. EMB25]MCY9787087.1 ATP-binding protein [Nocardiopsis sp. EMB25]